VQSFSDLATAAYCPRKLYYRRSKDDYDVPDEVTDVRELAFEYDRLLNPETDLQTVSIEPTPTQYRSNLGSAKARLDRFDELSNPPKRDVLLEGKACRGVAHKILEKPPIPSIISTGEPPPRGVWEPQTVRATAAAKALAWERQHPVESAYVEYPAYGVIRSVPMTVRRKAAYRRAFRAARSIDGPPPRLHDTSRCASCAYRAECGTKTRSLRSRLSF